MGWWVMTEKVNMGVHWKIQFLGDGVGEGCHEKNIGDI